MIQLTTLISCEEGKKEGIDSVKLICIKSQGCSYNKQP